MACNEAKLILRQTLRQGPLGSHLVGLQQLVGLCDVGSGRIFLSRIDLRVAEGILVGDELDGARGDEVYILRVFRRLKDNLVLIETLLLEAWEKTSHVGASVLL